MFGLTGSDEIFLLLWVLSADKVFIFVSLWLLSDDEVFYLCDDVVTSIGDLCFV